MYDTIESGEHKAIRTAADRNQAIIDGIAEAKRLGKYADTIVPNLNSLMESINNAAVTVEATFDALSPILLNQLESSTKVTEAAKHRLDDLQTTIGIVNQQIQKIGWSVDEVSKSAQMALNQAAKAFSVLKWGLGVAVLMVLVFGVMYGRNILAGMG